MTSTKQNDRFPPLINADPKIADPGKVRLGDTTITGQFPPLRLPDAKIADPGKVRLGDTTITGRFPLKK
jgi:hypothetical protein